MSQQVPTKSTTTLAVTNMRGVTAHTGPVAGRDDQCSICLEQIKAEDTTLVHELNCGNCFHRHCLRDHLERNSECPLCRTEIRPKISRNAKIELLEEYFQERCEKHGVKYIDEAIPGFVPQNQFLWNVRKANGELSRHMHDLRHDIETHSLMLEGMRSVMATHYSAKGKEVLEDKRIEGYRQLMRGESQEKVDAEYKMAEIAADSDYHEDMRSIDRQLKKSRRELEAEYTHNIQQIESRYEETIGYFVHVLRQTREKDPRASEWEDDPPVPI